MFVGLAGKSASPEIHTFSPGYGGKQPSRILACCGQTTHCDERYYLSTRARGMRDGFLPPYPGFISSSRKFESVLRPDRFPPSLCFQAGGERVCERLRL